VHVHVSPERAEIIEVGFEREYFHVYQTAGAVLVHENESECVLAFAPKCMVKERSPVFSSTWSSSTCENSPHAGIFELRRSPSAPTYSMQRVPFFEFNEIVFVDLVPDGYRLVFVGVNYFWRDVEKAVLHELYPYVF
jgi:hypothetical protein